MINLRIDADRDRGEGSTTVHAVIHLDGRCVGTLGSLSEDEFLRIVAMISRGVEGGEETLRVTLDDHPVRV